MKDLRKMLEEMRDVYVEHATDEDDARECCEAVTAIQASLDDKIVHIDELRKDRNILSLVNDVPTDVPKLDDLVDFVVRLGHPVQTK